MKKYWNLNLNFFDIQLIIQIVNKIKQFEKLSKKVKLFKFKLK